ncbi:hypothetical protein A5482_003980 [Cyanobacterium sp. IPPAS B-1200]|uniref:hypothetical protein n=1 Tax=Cyanobacterium sp. IPPAS B-1200 TaxID=1562720 RepID=UPI0008525C21|nr:hypothetical protein [Cyanobacterium sp. IPPAS B-1200]OEJ78316.1 hypothetical protein A5482_03525 [Cyanobacterium sp. IPPAS B-1200]
MKKKTLTTIIGTATVLTTIVIQTNSASAQTAFGYSSYSVAHNFRINFGSNTNVNLLGAVAFGDARCVNPFKFDDYFDSAITFPSVTVQGNASANCNGAIAQSSSMATGSIVENVLTGQTSATGYAFAVSPPGGFARARSGAALTAGQLGINPNGQIFWQPLFWDYVSGQGSAFASTPRLRDPIAYTIIDPNTNEIILEGSLLDISAEFDGLGSSVEWGFSGSPDPAVSGNESPSVDDNLNINFLNNGLFKIDLTDQAISNPGLLDLACENGLVKTFNASGRFSGVFNFFPTVGKECNTSIPLSLLNLDIDYDFTDIIPASEVNLRFELGGDGEGVARTSEPSSTINLLLLGIFGVGVTFKRKLKLSKSMDKESTNIG